MKPQKIILLLATLIPLVFGCANPTSSTSGSGSGSTTTPTTTTTLTTPVSGAQIIADHTVVSQYDKIPQKYIDLVKQMWVNVPGESHSQAYRDGLTLLASINSKFAVNVVDGTAPEAYTTAHLSSSRALRTPVPSWASGSGEQDWYTSSWAIDQMKTHLDYCNANNLKIAAFGFGWCWDMTWTNDPGGTMDPVYNVRWAGSSSG